MRGRSSPTCCGPPLASRCIATSRAALRVSGEQELPVPGLPAPPDPSQLSSTDRLQLPGASRAVDPASLGQYAAVRLFIERAVAVRPGFSVTNDNAPAVAAISARLHGMPLAIELAAARIKLLSPDAILVRLEHQLDVLAAGSRDLPARQQTLRGAIAWSYDLLDEGGRLLLDRLSVFAGGCDLETAEAVCGPASELGGDLAGRADGARRPEPAQGRGDGGRRAALPPPRHDPRVRRRATGRARRDRAHPRVDIATGTSRSPSAPRAQLSGDRAAPMARPTRARARRHPRRARPRRGRSRAGGGDPARRSRCGASGRSTATWPRPGAGSRRWTRRTGRTTIRASGPGCRRPSAACAGGRPTSSRWVATTTRRSRLWQALGDDAELANAHYNASFFYAIPTDRTRNGRGGRPRGDRSRPSDEGPGALPQGRQRRRRGQRRVGPRQLRLLPQPPRAGHRRVP